MVNGNVIQSGSEGDFMKRSDLVELEKAIMEEVVTRRRLGGYSQDAGGILLIAETLMRILTHIIDEMAPPEEVKPPAKKKAK